MQQLVYRIKDIEAQQRGVDIDVPLPTAFLSQALQDTGADISRCAATVVARLSHTGQNVICRGTLRGQVSMECQRCLGPATIPVDVNLNTTFVPAGTSPPSEERPFDPDDPDDLEYAHHDRDLVDLGPLVREQLILSLPITILCREDCPGLCPVCGGDRNTTACGCQQTLTLSPFSALKDLKV